MSVETIAAEPVFDPRNVGASLDMVQAQLPLRSPFLRGNVLGEFPSRLKGDGMEPDGVRAYEPGDDPRHIDWNITARSPDQWPQIRNRHAEITPSVLIVTDTLQKRYESNPGYFSEQELGLSALTAIMRIAHVNNMPSRVIAAADHALFMNRDVALGRSHLYGTAKSLAEVVLPPGEEETKPAKKGRPVMDVITSPEDSLRIGSLLKRAAKLSTESVVVVISDFRDVAEPNDPEHGWMQPMLELARRKNEVIAVELTSPWDYKMPTQADRFTTSKGVAWVDMSKEGRQTRQRYEELAAEQQQSIDDTLATARTHHVKLSTAEPGWMTSFLKQIASKQ